MIIVDTELYDVDKEGTRDKEKHSSKDQSSYNR